MTVMGEPLGFFVPGLLIVAVLGLLGWWLHRRAQASPAARQVRARGWHFEDAQQIGGPLPGTPGVHFRSRFWAGEAWPAQPHETDGPSAWELRLSAEPSARPAALPALPRERAYWHPWMAQTFGPLDDAQWQLEGDDWVFTLRVQGIAIPADTEALVHLTDACLQRLTPSLNRPS